MTHTTRAGAAVAAILLALIQLLANPAAARAQGPTATLTGRVLDAVTGLPLANASVAAQGPSTARTQTDDGGAFTLSKLATGAYVLEARLEGYQSAQSDAIVVTAGPSASATLTLRRLPTGGETQVIGRTTTSATAALQNASVVSRSVTIAQVQDSGYYRLGDALKTLPGVIVSGAQTSAPGDDVKFTIRGIGVLETLTLIDGHPIAQGLPGGFSYELSPTVALRDASVVYGSGSDLYPVAAIGGIINMQTIEPSRKLQTTVSTNFGTYTKTGLSIVSTGPITDRLSYAVGVSSQGTDGVFRNTQLYNFSAVNGDPSGGPATAAYKSGVYNVDTATNQKTAFGKLRYDVDANTHLTFSALSTGFYDDKTGNGDLDYQTNDFTAANVAIGSGGCPANQYPTGGSPACLPPAQYFAYFAGPNGAGPAWQGLHFSDFNGTLKTKLGGISVDANAFTNVVGWHYDRMGQLPYFFKPGDNPTMHDTFSSATGAIVSGSQTNGNNSIALGAYVAKLTYTQTQLVSAINPATNLPLSTNVYGNNVVNENSFFLRDAFQFADMPMTVFANGWLRYSSATSTTNFDPRLAFVYTQGGSVFRLAAGITTTQPDLSTSAPFTPVPLGSLVGAHGSVVSIGSIPSAGLLPERGTDVEFGVGRRLGGNSLIQATLYATNVANKIYSSKVKASTLAAGTISPAILTTYGNYLAGLGVTGALGVNQASNLGQVLAQGIELNGVQQLPLGLRFDYDYATESTQLVGAATSILTSNLALIPGSQLPNVPLHRYNLGFAWSGGRQLADLTARLGYHYEDENNPRNLPAYGYYDLGLSAKIGPGKLAVFVDNLFNQWADWRGLEFSGYSYALNKYADPTPGGDYAPQIGAAATEEFFLPYRKINLTYTFRLR